MVRSGLLAAVMLAAGAVGKPGEAADAAETALPENLARRATAWASSEHNEHYLAKFAIDGRVPPAGSRNEDLGAAWCVLKRVSGDRADLTLTWSEPVRAATLIYFGRTSWFMEECWREYEVLLDDRPTPVARGELKMVHGPQPIALPGEAARKITIRFLSSHGGMNPGAAEVMVFERPLTAAELRRLARETGGALDAAAEEADPPALARLIDRLAALHGDRYARAQEHRRRLAALAQSLAAAGEDDSAAEKFAGQLADLQREVLLWDVERLLVIKRYEIDPSHVYTYHYEGQRDGGGLYVVDPHDPQAAPRELVASPRGQILDCDLSYDGRRVLFSWRTEPGGGYHVWCVDLDGANLVQLTDGPWHDYNACWLPDGGIAFLSTRNPQFAYCWHAPVGILHRMEADGSNVRRLSANYLNDFTPAVLEDGRLLYSRWEYVDRPAIPIQSLWTIYPDGTGLAGYFGNRVLSPGTFMEARPIPGTTKVVCTMTGHNGPARGAIGVLDRARGVNAQAAIVNITPDVPVPPVDQGNGNTGGSKQYSSPLPLDRERLLLSARGPVLVRDFAGECRSVAVPAPGDGMQYFAAQPVRPRSRPPAVPPRVDGESADSMATVYLQDVYNGLAPHVRRGEVKAIRVVREMEKTVRIDPSLRAFGFQFPVVSCGATYAPKEVLGETPVDDDGSAAFRVPAGVPVYFMALDAEGRAVQRMRSFTHFMPGESQGCIGCHEHRGDGPPAQAPQFALFGQPRELTPPEWGAGGFDYARVVQPVLDRHCVGCHDAYHPQGIDLTGDATDFFNVSYEVLARQGQGRFGSPYVNWIPTYNGQEWNILLIEPKAWGSPASRLAEIVLSGHPDAEGNRRVELGEWERRRILAWIDLNVPYYGTSETAHPTAPGCRQMLPARLEEVLAEVAARRCASCHAEGKFPRREWTRITNPQWNSFLMAPLPREKGGSGRCGSAVFADANDPDYRAILATFAPLHELLRRTPRMDMPGALPSYEVNRSCQ